MNSFQLYRTWYPCLAQLIPDKCSSRLTNLTWLIVGLYQSLNVHLSAIVRKWPMAVCLLYVWLLAVGQRAIRYGQRTIVDRVDRRDLSLFRIGWYLIEKFLALQNEFTVRLYPLVSGS